jgi:hypothetical protein
MADLLECVIQIKALRETLAAMPELVSGPIPARNLPEMRPDTMPGLWERMADAERRYALALGVAGGDIVRSGEDETAARSDFAALRGANMDRLEHCAADELAGFVEWAGRPSTTVADLVAIMLANDTDVLGEVRCAHPREPSC